ncbi:unnamed protein product [Lathyrus sativus]|nr:unnamed protein product [Lathyrus sativus]
MSYSIGTPPHKVYGVLDTGSNLIWLQCKPCNICYNQTDPIFNSSKSLTYKKVTCSSKTCKSTEGTSCSYNRDACEYTLEYDPGSKTQGDLSMDTITLHSTSGFIVSFPKIVIGCGRTNTWSTPYNGPSSGIIGFGKGPTSLIKQLGSSINGKFSYCLSANEYYRKFSLSSKLNFGDSSIVSGDKVVSTPMVKMIGKEKDYYYLNLKAFSVENKRIKYRGFKKKGVNASTHNIIIDSGTTVTLFPRHFYFKLESAVKKVVKLERFHDDTDSSRLCYNTTLSQQSNFLEITAHFSGADIKLDPRGVFTSILERIKKISFRPHRHDLGLFGNRAQANHLIGYDLKKKYRLVQTYRLF